MHLAPEQQVCTLTSIDIHTDDMNTLLSWCAGGHQGGHNSHGQLQEPVQIARNRSPEHGAGPAPCAGHDGHHMGRRRRLLHRHPAVRLLGGHLAQYCTKVSHVFI